MVKIYTILVNCLCLLLCLSSMSCKTQKLVLKKPMYQNKIVQDAMIYDINSGLNEITLERKSFAFHFYNKAYKENDSVFHATQIACFVSPEALGLIADQALLDEVIYFMPGSGLAAPKGKPYDSMYLMDDAHHYIFYDPMGNKRAKLLQKFPDGMLSLKWEVNRFFTADRYYSFADLPWDKVYCVLYYDQNHNGKIETNEYQQIIFHFNS